MGLFQGILFCSDLDGTLTHRGVVPPVNVAAIRSFIEEGGLFTLSTGRPVHYIHRLPGLSVNAPVIAVNGTLVHDLPTGQTLLSLPLPRDYADPVRDALAAFPSLCSMALYTAADAYPMRDARAADSAWADIDGALKVVLVFEEGAAAQALVCGEALRQSYGERYTFSRSWPTGLEMTARGSGKGACMTWLRERHLPDIHTLVCIGDYENDLSMFAASDLSFAPANAIDAVKAAATQVVCSAEEGALAAAVTLLRTHCLKKKGLS
ncbi:MAG: HAD-IIB family hydrolase [Eubacteriales bacterium]